MPQTSRNEGRMLEVKAGAKMLQQFDVVHLEARGRNCEIVHKTLAKADASREDTQALSSAKGPLG